MELPNSTKAIPLHIKRATVNQWLAFSFFRVSSYRVSSVLEPADTPSGSPEPSQFFVLHPIYWPRILIYILKSLNILFETIGVILFLQVDSYFPYTLFKLMHLHHFLLHIHSHDSHHFVLIHIVRERPFKLI